MTKLVNRAKMTTATTGTGTITLGSAVDGFQTFAAAGVANADVVRYVIEDGDNWEIGTGTYTASGTTLSRTVQESSAAGSAISLSGNAVVFVSATAEDFDAGGGLGIDQTWQEPSRNTSTTYQNTTGAPIAVSVAAFGVFITGINLHVSNSTFSSNPSTPVQKFETQLTSGEDTGYMTAMVVVPDGHFYRAEFESDIRSSIESWWELR
jgi:hypothetical protein